LDAEFSYAIGLLHPWALHAERVPSPMPIPTATCTLKGVLNLQCNASCMFMCYLNPWSSNASNTLSYNNNVAFINDLYSHNVTGLTTTVPGLNGAANMTQYRVVSCGLRARDLSTLTSQTGTVSFGCIPNVLGGYSTANADTIRDCPMVKTMANIDTRGYVGGVYLPTGPDALNLVAWNVGLNTHVIPILYFSGLAPSAVISLEYVINYEFVPAVGQTDLLSVSYPPSGSHDGSLRALGGLMRVDQGAATKVHATAKTGLKKGIGSTISNLLYRGGNAILTHGLPLLIEAFLGAN